MCLRFGAKQTRIACGMKERCLVVHNISPSSSHLCLQGLLLIDVLDNQILRRRGSKEDQERCLMKTFQMTPTIMIIPKVSPSCSGGRLLYGLQPGTGRHQRYPPSLQEMSNFCFLSICVCFSMSFPPILHTAAILKICLQEAF